jgi:hypothetical protein
MESILTSVKKMLGIENEYTHFDQDIIMHINTVLATLTQIGVGPSTGFSIQDENAIWSDFVPASPLLEPIKTYTYLKVKLIFDPPLSSAVTESYNRTISELESRISYTVDPGEGKIQNG